MERKRIAPIPEVPETNFEELKLIGSKIGSLILRPIVAVKGIFHDLSVGLGASEIKPEDIKLNKDT